MNEALGEKGNGPLGYGVATYPGRNASGRGLIRKERGTRRFSDCPCVISTIQEMGVHESYDLTPWWLMLQ